jgi:hypothetical protein
VWPCQYNHLYVYDTAFETGGQLWPIVFRCVIWCLFVGQLVFTILLGLNKATAPAIISAPLVVLPWLFNAYINRAFVRRTEVLPLDAANVVDTEREKRRVKGLRGANSTAFLDDSSALQDFGVDVDDIRTMRAEDRVFPHNTATQLKTETYHKDRLNGEQQVGTGGGRKGAVGRGPGGDLRAGGRPAEEAKQPRDGGAEAEEEESLMHDSGRTTAAASIASSQSGLRIDVDRGGRPPVPNHGVHRATSSGQWSASNLRAMLSSRSSSTVLQSTLRGGEALGALPLPLDYVQPELVGPPHIPIPHVPPPIVEPTASVGQDPSLLDEELSWAALERRQAAKGTSVPALSLKDSTNKGDVGKAAAEDGGGREEL